MCLCHEYDLQLGQRNETIHSNWFWVNDGGVRERKNRKGWYLLINLKLNVWCSQRCMELRIFHTSNSPLQCQINFHSIKITWINFFCECLLNDCINHWIEEIHILMETFPRNLIITIRGGPHWDRLVRVRNISITNHKLCGMALISNYYSKEKWYILQT